MVVINDGNIKINNYNIDNNDNHSVDDDNNYSQH